MVGDADEDVGVTRLIQIAVTTEIQSFEFAPCHFAELRGALVPFKPVAGSFVAARFCDGHAVPPLSWATNPLASFRCGHQRAGDFESLCH